MNYKELQQIAKEVGAVIDVLMLGRHDNTVFTTGELERFAAIVEKRTIERCAVVCEMLRDLQIYADKQEAQNDCAAAIRAME